MLEIVLHLRVFSTVNKRIVSIRAVCVGCFCIFSLSAISQKAILTGVVLDQFNSPISSVNVSADDIGTTTNENGFYSFEIIANQEVSVVFSHLSFNKLTASFHLKVNEKFEFNPVLQLDVEQIAPVVINQSNRDQIEGITTIAPAVLRNIKGAQPGVENILKTLPGVSISNELSTQYNVRGGNFDENLVYVQGIEIYRPFLIRSGQQEGLSFVNSNLIKNLKFSAGGFQSKYGDKMSSVLDIEYRTPTKNKVAADFSLLGFFSHS